MKRASRILIALFAVLAAIAWCLVPVGVAWLGWAFHGMSDGGAGEPPAPLPLSRLLLLVGIWLVPMTAFVLMFLSAINVLKGAMRGVAYWYSLVFLIVVAHSMGNVVTGSALQLAGTTQVANTYVASQAAVPAHAYDATITTPFLLPFTYTYPSGLLSHAGTFNRGPFTPNIYSNALSNNFTAVGRRISYFNTNDFALAMPRWGFDQIMKPDTSPTGHYFYAGTTNDPPPWNNFEFIALGEHSPLSLDIVSNLQNRYEAYSFAAQSYSTALGATPNVHNFGNADLTTIWPSPDPFGGNYSAHFYHSAQFRGDAPQEWGYWHTLLFSSTLGFNISH